MRDNDMRNFTSFLTVSVAFTLGCSFIARGPEDYRDATAEVLEAKRAEIKSCYDGHLERDPTMGGKVVLNFTVEQKTGTFTNVQADPATTAPEALTGCVMTAIQGLKLAPEDRRDGLATFSWEFRANTPAPAPAA
jgi:hypothetical protein